MTIPSEKTGIACQWFRESREVKRSLRKLKQVKEGQKKVGRLRKEGTSTIKPKKKKKIGRASRERVKKKIQSGRKRKKERGIFLFCLRSR